MPEFFHGSRLSKGDAMFWNGLQTHMGINFGGFDMSVRQTQSYARFHQMRSVAVPKPV
jgi:hypothetical protein